MNQTRVLCGCWLPKSNQCGCLYSCKFWGQTQCWWVVWCAQGWPECPTRAHKPYCTLLSPPMQWMTAHDTGLQTAVFCQQLVAKRAFHLFCASDLATFFSLPPLFYLFSCWGLLWHRCCSISDLFLWCLNLSLKDWTLLNQISFWFSFVIYTHLHSTHIYTRWNVWQVANSLKYCSLHL